MVFLVRIALQGIVSGDLNMGERLFFKVQSIRNYKKRIQKRHTIFKRHSYIIWYCIDSRSYPGTFFNYFLKVGLALK